MTAYGFFFDERFPFIQVLLSCEFLCVMDPSELAVLPSRLVSERFVWDVEIAEKS